MLAHDGEGPSPDEVRRRIDSLYDRAESDTGTFNATRAAAIPRQRGTVARGRSEKNPEPAVGGLARQWFDVARAKLGPSVPAWQSDRKPPARPDRAPQAARPVRPAERPAELRALEAPPAPTGVALELTGGSAQAAITEILPDLSGRRAAPAAADESRRGDSASPVDAQPGLGGDAAAWPLYEPGPAPAPESGPPSLAALPAVQDPDAGAYRVGPPTDGPQAYGAGPATGATAPYATPLSADLAMYHAPGPSAEATTTTRGAGLPDIPASALAAHAPAVPMEPATASAPAEPAVITSPTAPDALSARETPATAYTPGAYGGAWPTPLAGSGSQAQRVIDFARAQIGLPCVWGAVGPGSYDAAGLTQAAWRTVGVTLPRTIQGQWRAGVQVPLADVQVGDLVFFHDDLGHVGIWSGDGMMIHASGPGALIREESVFFAGQSAIKGAIRPA
ncbi:NlpC/P60 family protein [Streptomyces sp. NPDC088801]|uniref:C40 family peptidase n=1 Tax=Streptomyces sp. NPDC088801 TaxID=3365903 RepID=UPI00382883B4